MSIGNDIRHQWQYGSAVMRLLLLNVGIFLLQSLGLFVAYVAGFRDAYLNDIANYFYASTDLSELIRKPWTIFTYMFMHSPMDIFHILSNMLYLYFFGRIFSDFIQPKMAYPLYLVGGLVGLFIEVAVFNLVPNYQHAVGSLTVGASAAVMAIVLATATLVPDFTVHLIFIGPVRLKYIAAFVVIIDLLSISAEENLGGHLAHLGGALTGYLYIRSYRRSGNWFSWWPRLEALAARPVQRRKPKVAYVNPNARPSVKKDESADKQKQLDAILDKIRASGYDSLSKQEKDFLFRISNEK